MSRSVTPSPAPSPFAWRRHVQVSPAGGKLWRLKYRFQRREKRLALGQYPEITLAEARDRRAAARKLLAHGIDPSGAKRAEKAAQADTCEAVAREWRSKQAPRWGAGHATFGRCVKHGPSVPAGSTPIR
jgi:Arm domain-containing DNA-binding protein